MPIFHSVIGEGRPAVMLAGWSLDHRVMLRCLEPVFRKRQGWRRIYLDLPGTGRSRPEPSIRTSDDMLAAVLDSLDAVIGGEPFVVCGYSYGAQLARGLAQACKDLVRGLLLMAPLTVAESADRALPKHLTFRGKPALTSKPAPEEAKEFVSDAVILGEREWLRYRSEIIVPRRSTKQDYLDDIRQSGYGITFDDAAPATFEYPALIITGRQDDVVGFEDAWRLIKSFPRATFAALDAAGHLLQIDQPRVFNTLVNNWLDRVELGPPEPSRLP